MVINSYVFMSLKFELKQTYPAETYAIRQANWTVAPVPKELQKRWIEITGPPSKKGCINAMNSGADVWMVSTFINEI